jgi:hypothetical protein
MLFAITTFFVLHQNSLLYAKAKSSVWQARFFLRWLDFSTFVNLHSSGSDQHVGMLGKYYSQFVLFETI